MCSVRVGFHCSRKRVARSFRLAGLGPHRAHFDPIEGFYNAHQCHSTLDYLSPVTYEKRWTIERHVPQRFTVTKLR